MDKQKPERVITVRFSKALHQRLKWEASVLGLSLNRHSIAKLSRLASFRPHLPGLPFPVAQQTRCAGCGEPIALAPFGWCHLHSSPAHEAQPDPGLEAIVAKLGSLERFQYVPPYKPESSSAVPPFRPDQSEA